MESQVSAFDSLFTNEDIKFQLPKVVGVGGSVDFSAAVQQLTGESASQ